MEVRINKATSKDTHQSVNRVLKILLAFSPSNKPMGTKQLSELFGLHMSTTSRLLKVLLENDFLQFDVKTKEYSLGRSILLLGKAMTHSLKSQVIVVSKPYVDNLSEQIGETFSLEVMAGNTTTLSYSVNGWQPIQISFGVGDRLPIHVAAGAKAILAFSEPEVVDSLLAHKLEKFTENTITDVDALKKQLKEIRKAGIAFDRGERDKDIHAIGAPIFDFAGKPIAALVMAALSTRMEEYLKRKNLAELIKSTAGEISKSLFFKESSEL